ncbi:MAG: phosphoserine phosphatase SerB [Actinobacteria bacterium]|uniref:Phosphoserine phosphatase n=1 Tax=Candidatus Fonsibacter lacus TaxID=2576439 RepID=A0A965LKI3_9PROT|nr:phosphoserine phosphatase SerB [Candidatus Fonsibacter lacus]
MSTVVILSGMDRPGITQTLFEEIDSLGISHAISDIEQVVIHGHLILTLALEISPEIRNSVLGKLDSYAATHGLELRAEEADHQHIETDTADSFVHVTVMGRELTAGPLGKIASIVREAGGNIERIFRIAHYPVTAIELLVSNVVVDNIKKSLAEVANTTAIDIGVQSGGLQRRAKKLVVLDVDSTLIQQEVIELLAEHAGVGPKVKEITDRAMNGEIDFAQALQKRVELLTGLSEKIIDEVRGQITLTPGARTLIRTLKKLHHKVGIVSGGFTEVITPIAQELGIDFIAANHLEIRDGKLTGKTKGEIIDRAGKANALRQFAALADVDLADTVAIGDGANDLDMIALAGLGIAFNAKPVVRASADTSVNTPYLDSVLYLLGIPGNEI